MDQLAEREGFEPPVPRGTTVFKTAAFDHSAISPSDAKVEVFSFCQKYMPKKLRVFIRKKDKKNFVFRLNLFNLVKPK